MPFGANDARAREDAKVRGHGVLRHIELTSDFTRGHAVWFVANQ